MRIAYLLSLALITLAGGCNTPSANILIVPQSADDVVLLRAAMPDSIQAMDSDPTRWLAVFVDERSAASATTPVQGTYLITDDTLSFRPDFPFDAGTRYRIDIASQIVAPPAVTGIPIARDGQAYVGVHFELADLRTLMPPEVVRVLPASDVLPANTLRFYIDFSNPMQRAWKTRKVRLLDGNGAEIENVLMEFKQELWSADQTRLTVLLDPGRIKQGVGTNIELGPALRVGEQVTLLVEEGWPDADGQSLATSFKKTFRVTEPIRTGIEPERWQLQPPQANTQQDLTLTFDRPMDHALLLRMLTVIDSKGRAVQGSARVEDQQTQWHFHPDTPWPAGAYRIVVQAELEDVAGNNLCGPLDRSTSIPEIDRNAIDRPFRVNRIE